jgi:hypothetical protein
MKGECNLYGIGTPENKNLAVRCYEAVAIEDSNSAASVRSFVALADCMEKAIGTDKDTEAALTLYKRAAEFGDPEAMNVLPILESGFTDICFKMATGTLDAPAEFAKKATVCKYVVPKGYGVKSESGHKISVDEEAIKACGATVYYANVDMKDGELVTGTSRSVGVIGIADTLEEAEQNCEKALEHVKCDAIFVRHDIGTRALVQRRVDHMNQLRSA